MKKLVVMLMVISLSCISLFGTPNAYKKCIACHGAKGEKVALGKSKIIKDMTKKEIEDSMIGYQKGTYGGAMKALMMAQSKGLSASDIKQIANAIGK